MQNPKSPPPAAPQPAAPQPVRTIGVLLFDRFSNHCLANAVEPLRAANTFAGRRLYDWHYLGIDGAPVVSSSGLPVQPQAALSRHPGGDLLFVMPSYGFRDHATPAALRALRSAATRFRVLAGMDTGAWLLAAAGLLHRRRATIHWDELTAFAERFPDVDVREDRVVVDGDRLTCGGVTTTFDLVIDLVRRHHGPLLALEVAALFVRGDAADPRLPSVPATGRPAVDRAVRAMRRNIETPLPLASVAEEAGVSQRTLETAFRAALGLTPRAVYARLRLREARRLAEGTATSVEEIAARCGYLNASALTRAFRTEFGATPTALRRAALSAGG